MKVLEKNVISRVIEISARGPPELLNEFRIAISGSKDSGSNRTTFIILMVVGVW